MPMLEISHKKKGPIITLLKDLSEGEIEIFKTTK